MGRRRKGFAFYSEFLVLALLLVAVIIFLSVTGRWGSLLRRAGIINDPVSVGQKLVVDCIDVGNADAILLRCGEDSLLIDSGCTSEDGHTVLRFLADQGVTKLNYIVATHFDADHIGGMATVLRGIKVEQCLLAERGADTSSGTYRTFIAALARADVPVNDVTDVLSPLIVGESFALGDAACTVVGPVTTYPDDNDSSIVLHAVYGERSFLFMGDAGIAAEADISAAYPKLHADVIKLGHHGSSTSSHETFLKRVDPQIALISCGAGNPYGHPHKEIIECLDALGIRYYRTDLCGTVTVTCDGKALDIQTRRNLLGAA